MIGLFDHFDATDGDNRKASWRLTVSDGVAPPSWCQKVIHVAEGHAFVFVCHQCGQDTCITWAGSFWRNEASLMMFVSRPNWISWCAALSAASNEIWLARASGGPCDAAPEPVTMATNRLRFYSDTTLMCVSFTRVSLPLCLSSALFVEVFFLSDAKYWRSTDVFSALYPAKVSAGAQMCSNCTTKMFVNVDIIFNNWLM